MRVGFGARHLQSPIEFNMFAFELSLQMPLMKRLLLQLAHLLPASKSLPQFGQFAYPLRDYHGPIPPIASSTAEISELVPDFFKPISN